MSAPAQVMAEIEAQKLFAIVRGVSPDRMVAVVRALARGGVRLLEVAIDHSRPDGVAEVVRSLALITTEFGDQLCCGAGTVLTVEQVHAVGAAGARFVVSPNVDENVVGATRQAGLVSLPGAMTPTEVVAAQTAGAHAVKLFPAGVLGAVYVKALLDPLKGVPLIAVGGVNEGNAASFFAAGAIAVGIGGSLVGGDDVVAGDFAAIEARAKAVVAALRGAA